MSNAAITTREALDEKVNRLPHHVAIEWRVAGLDRPTWVRTEDVRSVSERRFVSRKPVGRLADSDLAQVRRFIRMMADDELHSDRMQPDRIDLHTHSTASDGHLTPAALVRLARDEGLAVVALTDHDTTAGIDAAAAALPAGLTLVPGAEISCVVDVGESRPISLHLLAYLFDPAEPAFAAARARVRESRLTRARQMVDKLRADGHPVTWERVRELADGTVGRPHIAAALVEAGLVGSVSAAFTPDWIADRGRYWVGKAELDVWEALRLIRGAGGVAVFAHPFARRRGVCVDADVIVAMGRAGLAGVEVEHPHHDADDRELLRLLAAEHGLVATGSSDFHGGGSARRLGTPSTPRAAFEALVEQATGTHPILGPGEG